MDFSFIVERALVTEACCVQNYMNYGWEVMGAVRVLTQDVELGS